jgi:nitroreductase
MSGLTFFGTGDLEKMKDFYIYRVGMNLWLEQEDCAVFSHGNLLLGFCTREQKDDSGIITFFYSEEREVDEVYERLQDVATSEPVADEKYGIFHFFAADPEGRRVEFQCFFNPQEVYMGAEEMLLARRSIRHFQDTEVTQEVLDKIFGLCRFAPTSMNSESYYFIVVRDRKRIEYLAKLRGSNSAPIARAPIAVAVCADPEKTKRWDQDACIAAYHFLLAARVHGLGTCWIAAMDMVDAKECLGIPLSHYIATITPLGYPAESPEVPARRPADELVRYL